jgi:Tfp pilus assembly protein PilO
MRAVSMRAIWNAPYGRPFFVMMGVNLAALLLFTLPRAIKERRLAAQAVILRSQIAEQQASSAAARRQVEIIDANIKERDAFFKNVVQERSALPEVLEEINKTAAELGLKVGNQGYPRSDVKGAPLVDFEITLPLSGTYEQLGKFLQRMERSKHLILVSQVAMKSRTTDTGADLELKVEAFFHEEKESKEKRS